MSDKVSIGDDGHEKKEHTENDPKTQEQGGMEGVTEKDLLKDVSVTEEKTEARVREIAEAGKEKPEGGDEGKIAEKTETATKTKDAEENNTKTILSSQSIKSSDPSISITAEPPVTPSTSPSSQKTIKGRHQSDILPSLREVPPEEDASLMIFSSKGHSSKKYYRRREVNSTVLPFGFNEKDAKGAPPPASHRVRAEAELTPKISQTVPKQQRELEDMKKAPSGDKNSSNPSVARNVLTGCGFSNENDSRSKSARRKDGNPVLGLGYDDPVVSSNVTRVPPGGYSSGLW